MSDQMDGFELIEEREIPEVNGWGRLYRHVGTGASVLSVENDDSNKVFGITFRTPPEDSTGLPHILEHSVLCGSRKYPVKEPFVQLLKGSLNTFLNAMTYPDKTVYPVASQNLQDFYNLVDVYLDSVFHPRITPQTLQQEGWHYEVDSLDAPLSYKGVVFNEMKGVYSSPDSRLAEAVQQMLYPDTRYANDSGGDPTHIPDLTFEQFKAFHDRYYHPSNARIYFYGDDDPAERLRLLDGYLSDYSAMEPLSDIELQPRFDAPRTLSTFYPASDEEEGGTRRAQVTVAWLLEESTDPAHQLEMEVLGHLLVGTPASPLRKALIDSGLGDDTTGRGTEGELRQMAFTTGLKGIAAGDAEQVEALILETLAGLVRDGIDSDAVEAAMNSVEFHLRENNTGPYPRGLLVMLRALVPWLHDQNPMDAIAYEAPLAQLKQRVAEDPRYFEGLIQSHLLDNPHRVRVLLQPDSEMGARLEADEKARLAAIRATLSDAEVEQVMRDATALREAQERPDSPEALATIPTLHVSDMEKHPHVVPTEVLSVAGIRTLYHDLPTNGILYLDVGFDLRTLPQRLLPLVSLFGRALLETGSASGDFVRMRQRIDRKTGGLRTTVTASSRYHDREHGEVWLFLRGKAMVDQVGELAEIIHELLTTAALDNQERIQQLIMEQKASLEAALLPWGHRYVQRRLRAHFSEADWADEQISGIDQLFTLRELSDQVESGWPALHAHLEEIRDLLVRRGVMVINATIARNEWDEVCPALEARFATLPDGTAERRRWHRGKRATHEGFAIPGRVNYVGKAAPVSRADGKAAVITRHLRNDYLWDRIRVRGGAYGAFALLDTRAGILNFGSYRDPNLLKTLEVYDAAVDELLLEIGQEEVEKGIIGMIGDMDGYELPDAQGWSALQRYLVGLGEADRQRFRDEVLSTRAEDFAAFAPVVREVAERGHVAVIGSREALEEANEQLDRLEIVKLL